MGTTLDQDVDEFMTGQQPQVQMGSATGAPIPEDSLDKDVDDIMSGTTGGQKLLSLGTSATSGQQGQQHPTGSIAESVGQGDVEGTNGYTSNVIPPTTAEIEAEPDYKQAQQEQLQQDASTLAKWNAQFPNQQAPKNQTAIATDPSALVLPSKPDAFGNTITNDAPQIQMGFTHDADALANVFKNYFPQGQITQEKVPVHQEAIPANPDLSGLNNAPSWAKGSPASTEYETNLVFQTAPGEPIVRLSPTSQQSLMQWKDTITNPNVSISTKASALTDMMFNAAKNNGDAELKTLAFLAVPGPGEGAGILGALGYGAKLVGTGAITGATIAAGVNRSGADESKTAEAANGATEGAEFAAQMWAVGAGVKALQYVGGIVSGVRGIFNVSPAGEQVSNSMQMLKDAAVKEFGFSPEAVKAATMLPQDKINSPIISRLANIASSWFAEIKEFRTAQIQFLSDMLDKGANSKALEGAIPEAQKAVTTLRTQLKDELQYATAPEGAGQTPLPDRTFTQAGAKGAEDMASYMARSKPEVDEAYNSARGVEEPQFNFSHAINEAQLSELKLQKSADIPNADRQALQAIIDRVKNWEIAPPTAETKFGTSATGAENPIVSLKTTPLDDLRGTMQDLWEYAQPDVNGRVRPGAAIATSLRNSLDSTIHNPLNSNPEFTAAWRTANAKASERFSNGEWARVNQASKQVEGGVVTNPATFAKSLGTANQEATWDRLTKVVTPEALQGYREAVKANLLSTDNIGNMTEKLDSMSPDMVSRIFDSPQEFQAYKEFANEWGQVNTTNVEGSIAANQAGAMQKPEVVATKFVNDLLNTDERTAVTRVKVLQQMGALNPSFKEAVRAGIWKGLANKLIEDVKGTDQRATQQALPISSFQAEIKRLKNTTLDSFLEPRDKEIFNAMAEVGRYLDDAKDAGTSIVAAQGTWGLLNPLRWARNFEGMAMLAESKYISWSWTRGAGKYLMAGPRDTSNNVVLSNLKDLLSGKYGSLPSTTTTAVNKLIILLGHHGAPYEPKQDTENLNRQTDNALKNGTK